MSDRFLVKPYCLDCNVSLYSEEENIMPPMLAVGESLNLKCSKCKTVWRFYVGIKIHQEKLKESKKPKNK